MQIIYISNFILNIPLIIVTTLQKMKGKKLDFLNIRSFYEEYLIWYNRNVNDM